MVNARQDNPWDAGSRPDRMTARHARSLTIAASLPAHDPADGGEFRSQAAIAHYFDIARMIPPLDPQFELNALGGIARSKRDDVMIAAIDVGTLAGHGAGGTFNASRGDVCIIDLTEPLSLLVNDLAASIWILPHDLLGQQGLDRSGWHAAVLPQTSAAARLVTGAIGLASDLASQTASHHSNELVWPLAAMVAASIAQAEGTGMTMPFARGASTMAAIRRHIDEHLGDENLSVDSIAHHFGMARASLYRQFAALGGIASYIRIRRLQKARQLLANADDSVPRISTIARQFGFPVAASFSRAFRAEYGVGPRAFYRAGH